MTDVTPPVTPPKSAGPAVTLARTPPPLPGKLTTLAVLGGAVGALPLPYLPMTLTRRIRGAIAHDIAARHGVSLTEDARDTLSEPSSGAPAGPVRMTAVFFARRALGRFGILGFLPPLGSWLQVYAFGLLFERYMERARGSLSPRIHAPEAARVRGNIDAALARVLSPDLAPAPLGEDPGGVEDVRTTPTRIVDTVLLGLASIPGRMQHRLESAFDDVVRRDHQKTARARSQGSTPPPANADRTPEAQHV